MRQEIYTVIDYKEASALVGEFLRKPGYEDLVPDMGDSNHTWCNDTDHTFLIEPKEEWVQPNHDNEIAAVLRRGRPKWNFELASVLDELAAQGKIPLGNLLITVCW